MTLHASIRARLSPAFMLDVTLSLSPGITMLFGASGAGKSTLLRCLAGLRRPDAGRIAVDGRVLFDAAAGVDVPARARHVGFVFQTLALFPHLTVAENVGYGLAGLEDRARRDRVAAIAESFHIARLLQRRPAEISGGERQRTALARSLVTNPALLLLDEPLSALDYSTQSRIMDDVRAWNAAHAIPIVYVTHAHREVFGLGERVLVLEAGRIVADGAPHDVLEAPPHEPLAQLAGFENFFDATVTARSVESGTMQCRLDPGAVTLEAPLATAGVGERVRIALRAAEILLATEEPRGLSARNRLPGVIARLRRDGSIVVAEVDAGARFVSHVTPGAVRALQLEAGRPVWLVIRTLACRLVAPAARS